MRILVSGSTGLVGSALIMALEESGHEVMRLVRRRLESAQEQIQWDPTKGTIEKERLECLDAIVHLAGESIAAGRWNARRKQRILQSRVQGTRLLAETLAGLKRPPTVWVSASAIGYYG